jgi:hypothetical protein
MVDDNEEIGLENNSPLDFASFLYNFNVEICFDSGWCG